MKLYWRAREGFCWGCVAFVGALFVGAAVHGGADAYVSRKTGTGLLKLAVYCIVISEGFNLPGVIYEVDKLAVSLKALFQFGIGAIVYLMTAYFAGWMEEVGFIRYLIVALALGALGWGIAMIGAFGTANKMNRKIKEKEKEKE